MPCRPCKDDKTILREWALSSARWDDLRFIGLMPNLRSLTMVLVDTD